jgi:CheY-like chemotaxis protein
MRKSSVRNRYAMNGDMEKCHDVGCDAYATKPIDRHKLLELVAEFARRVKESAVLA